MNSLHLSIREITSSFRSFTGRSSRRLTRGGGGARLFGVMRHPRFPFARLKVPSQFGTQGSHQPALLPDGSLSGITHSLLIGAQDHVICVNIPIAVVVKRYTITHSKTSEGLDRNPCDRPA